MTIEPLNKNGVPEKKTNLDGWWQYFTTSLLQLMSLRN